MSKSTLEAVLGNLNLESEFIDTVGSQRDSAKLSFSLEDVLNARCLSLCYPCLASMELPLTYPRMLFYRVHYANRTSAAVRLDTRRKVYS